MKGRAAGVGLMRDRVVLQRVTRPQDDSGEPVERFADAAADWAQVTPLSSAEVFRARQAGEQLSHRVTMRYREGVAATTHRLVLAPSGRVLNIAGVKDLENRKEWMELTCLEAR